MTQRPEPPIGEQLVEVVLGEKQIKLVFSEVIFDVVTLTVKGQNSPPQKIDPENRSGAIGALWTLVGHQAVAALWGKSVLISFDDGSEVEIPPSESGWRGTLYSRTEMNVEDF
jgi:hypothetical protein